MHYLSQRNFPYLLSEVLEHDDLQYLTIEQSPVMEATPECSYALCNNFYALPENRNICERLTQEEILKLFELPDNISRPWFDMLVMSNDKVFTSK